MTGVELAGYAGGLCGLSWFTGYGAGYCHRFFRRIFVKSTS